MGRIGVPAVVAILVTVAAVMGGSIARVATLCGGRSKTFASFSPFPNDGALATATQLRTEKLRFSSDGKPNFVLVECGSFSPPTVFHLRLLEDARDAMVERGYHVAGGFLSPCHQKYGKKSLVSMHHRVNMVGLSLQDSSWLQVDSWECSRTDWIRTALVLRDRFQREVDKLHPGAKAMLVCGADLLESFTAFHENGEPVWSQEDQEAILGQCGVVCMNREGTDLDKVIAADPLLARNKGNIVVFDPSVQNNVSSTLVRRLLQQGKSLKYLVHDRVLDYIYAHDLGRFKAWGGKDE